MIDIKRKCYALASKDNNTAEITVYGDIVESVPLDPWTGELVEGNFFTQDEFLADLEKLDKCKDITIRINSYGGDCVVAFLVHNRLREMARSGKNLTCIVDGVAMSAGSIIMAACDTVKVNPVSLIMIHKCWTFLFGSYNADELRTQAENQNAYDNAIVAAYKRKTGLSETVISRMMSETTYMTGKEAVEKGFADELLDDADTLHIAASADGRAIICNGRTMHLAPGTFAPESIPTLDTKGSNGEETPIENILKQPDLSGRKEDSLMTIDELRAQYPEQIAQVESEAIAKASAGLTKAAVEAERSRMKEIDEVANLFSSDMVTEARYGETACNAAELSYRAAQKAAAQGKKFLVSMEADAVESGTSGIEAAAAPADDTENESPEAVKNYIKTLFK